MSKNNLKCHCSAQRGNAKMLPCVSTYKVNFNIPQQSVICLLMLPKKKVFCINYGLPETWQKGNIGNVTTNYFRTSNRLTRRMNKIASITDCNMILLYRSVTVLLLNL